MQPFLNLSGPKSMAVLHPAATNIRRIPMEHQFTQLSPSKVNQSFSAEATPQNSDRLVQSIVGNLPGTVYRCYFSQERVMWVLDGKVEELTGYPASHFLQEGVPTWQSIIHPDDLETIQQQLQEKLQQQSSYQLIYRLRNGHGKYQWIWDIGCGTFDDRGELLWLDGYLFPIDSDCLPPPNQTNNDCQRHLSQEQAEKNRLLRTIPDAIFYLDCQGTLLEYFPAESDPNALQPEAVTGKTMAEIFPADLADWFQYHCQQTLETGEIQHGEYNLSVNGTWHQYEARFTPSGTGKVLTIVRDISDRKRMEAELRMAQVTEHQKAKQLQETLEKLRHTQTQLVQSEKMSALGSMVAGIAHEINNPINFISGNIEYAIEYANSLLELVHLYEQYTTETPTEIQDYVEEIELDFIKSDFPQLLKGMRNGVERIGEIVRSLRNFSRIDEAEKKVVNIHDGLESTLAILQHRLRGKYTATPIQIEKNYGNLSQLECHPGLLNQVFANILTNAIDALEDQIAKQKNNQKPKISITTEETKTHIVIRLADNGPGIPESTIQRMFEPFFTTKPPGKGTGLGLSISYSIVTEKHGGHLSCLSQPEQGTEFVIELPKQTKTIVEH
jgi:PAS domain S-box-containing protein